jgi:hypothetical protein
LETWVASGEKTGGEIKLAKVGRLLLVEINSQGIRKEWGEGWGRKDKEEVCLLSKNAYATSLLSMCNVIM